VEPPQPSIKGSPWNHRTVQAFMFLSKRQQVRSRARGLFPAGNVLKERIEALLLLVPLTPGLGR
jgi:hypothetical protein